MKYEDASDTIYYQSERFMEAVNRELTSMVCALEENDKDLLYESALKLLELLNHLYQAVSLH